MPRSADHSARRAQMARAVLDIALEDGLGHVSVPRVAASAGVSVGLVQHYFPTKAGLVVTAYEELAARLDDRIAAIVDAGEEQGRPIRDMVGDALAQLLPGDAPRTAQARVRAEFATRALRHEGLAPVARRLRAGLVQRLTTVIDNGRSCGETDPDADAHDAAIELLGLTDGLASSLLLNASDSAEVRHAQDVVGRACARVFPGRCRLNADASSGAGRGVAESV